MIVELWIDGPLPGQNEIIAAAKTGRGRFNGYARLKAQWSNDVFLLAKANRLKPWDKMANGPAEIEFQWRERGRRRDFDNIAAGAKFVLDGLVKAGVLAGDGWSHVWSITHWFGVDAKRPGVLVRLSPSVPF